MQTYNQIIKLNREFATNHHVLKHFGNGPGSDVPLHNQKEWLTYPVMWMEDIGTPLTQNELTFSFRVYFLDQVAQVKDREGDLMSTNENEVKSDMIQCALDLMAFWAQDSTYPDLDLIKSSNINTELHKFSDRITGCSIDLKLKQAFRYNKCAIPMSGVTPPPSALCQPVTFTVNTAAITDSPSGTSKTIIVQNDATIPAQVGTILTDTITSLVIEVPEALSLTRVYWKPPYSGQLTSFRDGDTKWRLDNEIGKLVQPSYGIHMSLQFGSLWLLNPTNVFGNQYRYTGTSGGYYNPSNATYYDVNDVVTTRVLAFPNYLMCDHMTSTIFQLESDTYINWNTAIDSGLVRTIGAFTGWYLPSSAELQIHANRGVISGFRSGSPPIDWGAGSVVTSDTYMGNVAYTQAWGGTNITQLTPLLKGNSSQIIYMKEIDFNTEL